MRVKKPSKLARRKKLGSVGETGVFVRQPVKLPYKPEHVTVNQIKAAVKAVAAS